MKWDKMMLGAKFEVSLAVEKEKKDTFAYRALDQIRNYALHRSFPLKGTGIAASWEGEPPNHQNRYTVSPILNLDELRKDPRFNRDVLKQLEELQMSKGDLNLTQLLR